MSQGTAAPDSTLRHRNAPTKTSSDDAARLTVLQLNAIEEAANKTDSERKTYGRTPDGTIFTVPTTHDMVSQLLSPTEPKNTSDLLVIAVLCFHILLLYLLPNKVAVPVFGLLFTFWRACYNVGIGWLLKKQSCQQSMVRWARKTGLFEAASDCKYPRLRSFIKNELERKIPRDYNFDRAPLEYNTWLVFRRVVDLILMCDFTAYILFAFACGRRPQHEVWIATAARWTVGIVFFLFNLWVKLDAHRVVKDYAWYWGDFFFLVDQDLTFDGVFEMAPHPMYSIGYIGYYGISLMAASYKVMFISIFAHAAQFAFLVLVENPHIEKTYNAPPPRRQLPEALDTTSIDIHTDDLFASTARSKPTSNKPPATHDLLGFNNLDLYRTTDSSSLIIQGLLLLLTVSTPNTSAWQVFFAGLAAMCRLWYSGGIGYLLYRQSETKQWTRHFLKYGESTMEAWRQWKGTYNQSMIMCYGTFTAVAWKMYTPPESWDDGLVLLKHTIGFFMIVLQIWVAFSVYDQLGEFGWFFGDFFFSRQPKLTYGGIYRFLNNPERVLGLAGVWGIALITNSRVVFGLAALSHALSLLFIQFVEQPHMQKLYGRHLRQDAGLVKSLRRSLPLPLRHWQDAIDKVVGEALDSVDEFLDVAKPQLGARIHNNVVSPTRDMLSKYPGSITITRIESDLKGLDPKEYSLDVEGEQLVDQDYSHESGKVLTLQFGAPIRVKWTAPKNHGKLDWVGLYKIASNVSREVTKTSSQGRWVATNTGEYNELGSERGILSSNISTTKYREDGSLVEACTGEMVFSGDKLFWEQGLFEFRYHHNGKHNVMAVSHPFEIALPHFDEDDLELLGDNSQAANLTAQHDLLVRRAIEQMLLPVLRNCFDRDPDIAPSTPQETFGGLVERDGKYARRVVYAIQHMFSIELAPQVVKADGKVENLAWRIFEAKKVLVRRLRTCRMKRINC